MIRMVKTPCYAHRSFIRHTPDFIIRAASFTAHIYHSINLTRVLTLSPSKLRPFVRILTIILMRNQI